MKRRYATKRRAERTGKPGECSLQGIGFSGIVPTLITSLGDIYDGAAEATAQGIRIMAGGGSLVVFQMVAGVLVVANWRWPFPFYFGAVPLALLLARWFMEPTDADAEIDADAETSSDDEVEHSESDSPNGASAAAT